MLIVLNGKFYKYLKKTSGIQVLSDCRDKNTFQCCFYTSHYPHQENQIKILQDKVGMANSDRQPGQSEGKMVKLGI
jgi:hypothetical protein